MSFVFIGGCERSGTTLLGAEMHRAGVGLALPEAVFLVKALVHSSGVSSFVDAIERDWRLTTWPTPSERIATALDQARSEPTIASAFRSFAICALGHRDTGQPLIDSTPWSLRYVGLIKEAFPDARFVHIVRDGRAVLASVRRLDWGPSTPLAASTWWESALVPGLLADAANECVTTRYEDLVIDPDAVVARIAEGIGLARSGGWSVQGTESETETNGPANIAVGSYTESQHALLAERPVRSRISAWKEELSARDISLFEARSGQTLGWLGYELITSPRLISGADRLEDEVKAFAVATLGGSARRAVRRAAHARRSRRFGRGRGLSESEL
ncbi:MAG: sulfotransferase [Actinomycetia bacterium]|nr:sulfotransferase [Actinomycetes bacterium]